VLLRQPTKAETNYFRNFVDEIKALSIFGGKKRKEDLLTAAKEKTAKSRKKSWQD
jgi:hypothetical protein